MAEQRPTVDDMILSIARKMSASVIAARAIEKCPECGSISEPTDTGTDVDGTRLWVTMCCDKVQTYLEKVNLV